MYVIPTYKNIMIGVENSEEGQIVDYDQMIRIIYLQQLNAQIDIIYLPSQKTTLTRGHFLEGSQSTKTYLDFPIC